MCCRVWLFVTPWMVTRQVPLSMEFSRQEYWSGLPFPSPGDLPTPGIKPGSPSLQADALPSEPQKGNWRKPNFFKKVNQFPIKHLRLFLWSSAVLWWKSAELNVDASLNYILRRLSWKLGKEYRHSLAFYIHLCFDSAYFNMRVHLPTPFRAWIPIWFYLCLLNICRGRHLFIALICILWL